MIDLNSIFRALLDAAQPVLNDPARGVLWGCLVILAGLALLAVAVLGTAWSIEIRALARNRWKADRFAGRK